MSNQNTTQRPTAQQVNSMEAALQQAMQAAMQKAQQQGVSVSGQPPQQLNPAAPGGPQPGMPQGMQPGMQPGMQHMQQPNPAAGQGQPPMPGQGQQLPAPRPQQQLQPQVQPGAPAPMQPGALPQPFDPGQQPPAKPERPKRGFWSRLFVKENVEEVDLAFMDDVDAALFRRGQPRAYMISIGVLIFFAVFITWAAFTELDEVTRGEGQVVPSQKIQEIQYLEGGTLLALTVREGDDVQKDQVVARVSNSIAESALEDMRTQKATLEASVIRLDAEMLGKMPEFPAEIKKKYPNVVNGQLNLYNSHIAQRDGEMRTLQAQLEQRKREVQEIEARIRSTRENLAYAIKQRDTIEPLVKSGAYAPVDFIRLEREVSSLRGELDQLAQGSSRARSGVLEAEERIRTRRIEINSLVQEERNKTAAELNSVTTMIEARSDIVRRSELMSPVNGKVKRILLNTIGGTVPPGGTIMEILPVDERLIIEAKIKPTDRAFLHLGGEGKAKQKAIVKISTYDFSIYGGLEATLEHISDDAIEDNRGNVFFEVRLVTTNNAIIYHGESLPILPGMTAQVDILTGKKTVLSYLLKPILKAKQNALRER